jgi:hypothetical protein
MEGAAAGAGGGYVEPVLKRKGVHWTKKNINVPNTPNALITNNNKRQLRARWYAIAEKEYPNLNITEGETHEKEKYNRTSHPKVESTKGINNGREGTIYEINKQFGKKYYKTKKTPEEERAIQTYIGLLRKSGMTPEEYIKEQSNAATRGANKRAAYAAQPVQRGWSRRRRHQNKKSTKRRTRRSGRR